MPSAIGVSSIVYGEADVGDVVTELATTGVDACEVSIPHLNPDMDDAAIEEGVAAFEAAGIDLCGYGVVDIEDPAAVERELAFVDRIGGEYMAVNYPPARDDVTEALIEGAEARGIDVGIHNYSTVHHDDLSRVFSSVADVRGVLDRYESDRLGVCVDTGHFLVMDEAPEDVIPELGPRINSVHLKDTSDAEIEDVPGRGVLDVGEFLDLLGDHAEVEHPLIIEYEIEGDAGAVTEGLIEAERHLRSVL